MAQWLKEAALPQRWCGFNLWPRDVHRPQVWPKKKAATVIEMEGITFCRHTHTLLSQTDTHTHTPIPVPMRTYSTQIMVSPLQGFRAL